MNAAALSIIAALFVGLGGGAHCALMCGGISSAMVAGAGQKRVGLHALLAQSGRIASYTIAGTIVATMSAGALSIFASSNARTLVQVSLGLAWIAIAVQWLGWWRQSVLLTHIGAWFWKRLQPLTRRVWPVNTPLRALAAGALWGWLPCGMSYAMLMVAAATADPLLAAMMMLAFGLGTMPGTLLPALATARLQRIALSPHYRQIAAAAMLAFGAVTLTAPWWLHGAHRHHAASVDDSHAQQHPH